MKKVKKYKKGIIGGFAFGTLGLLLIAMLSLMSPVIEFVVQPLLWPGRQLAELLRSGDSMSTGMVFLLYLLTGILYALIGLAIQFIVQNIKKSRNGK